MQLIAYPISIIALFFTNIVVGAILLALIRGPKGHRGSWQFDPDPRYFFIDRIAQGLTKFSTSIISYALVFWIFSWFESKPHIVFLIIMAVFRFLSAIRIDKRYRPASQAVGETAALTIFFVYYFCNLR
jgi:hypothetical protein